MRRTCYVCWLIGSRLEGRIARLEGEVVVTRKKLEQEEKALEVSEKHTSCFFSLAAGLPC